MRAVVSKFEGLQGQRRLPVSLLMIVENQNWLMERGRAVTKGKKYMSSTSAA